MRIEKLDWEPVYGARGEVVGREPPNCVELMKKLNEIIDLLNERGNL